MSNPVPDASSTSGQTIANWITAAATSATAFIAWLAYHYSLRSTDPIVESDDPRWTNDGKIIWTVTVRNRSAMAHRLVKAHMRKPKGAGLSLSATVAPAETLDLSRNIYPVGTTSTPVVISGFDLTEPADQATLAFFVAPPSGWLSGKLRIDLIIADKSSKAKPRRFVIAKLISAMKRSSKADTTKQTV